MELRSKFVILLIFLFSHICLYAYDTTEAYEFSPIKFSNTENCILLKEEVYIHVFTLKRTYEIENKKEEVINCCINFTTIPDRGTMQTRDPYPVDYKITINGKKTDFKFINDGKEITDIETEGVNTCYDIDNSFEFPFYAKKGNNIIVIEYTSNFPKSPIHFNTDLKRSNDYKSGFIIDNENVNKYLCRIYDIKKENFFFSFLKEEKTNIPDNILLTKEKNKITLSGFETLPSSSYHISIGTFIDYAYMTGFSFKFYNSINSVYYYANGTDYSKTLFDKSDLIFMTPYQLSILRNGFYACHGYDFKNKEFKEIYKNPFTGKYQVNPNFSESDFNEIERKNIELIREIENLKNPILLSDFLETKLN